MVTAGWGTGKEIVSPNFPKLPRCRARRPIEAIVPTSRRIDQQLFPNAPPCAYKCIITIHVGEDVRDFLGRQGKVDTGQ